MGGCCGKEEEKPATTNPEQKQVAAAESKQDDNPPAPPPQTDPVEIKADNKENNEIDTEPAANPPESQPEPAPVEVKPTETFECERCQIKFDSEQDFEKHKTENHCPNCSKKLANEAAIAEHILKCPKRLVECPECKQQVMKQDLKGSHLKECNTEECEYCAKLIYKSLIEEHKSTKCLKRPVVTPCCSQEMTYAEMIKHVAKCPEVLEDCDFCGQDIRKGDLAEHQAQCEQEQKAKLEAEQAEAPKIDEMDKDAALARLKELSASVGFVAMDCPETGIRVVRLRLGSGSLYSFLCNGDLVRRMDETPILSIDDLKDFLNSKVVGDIVPTVVKRGVDGRIETIDLELCAQGFAAPLEDIRKLRQIAELPTSGQQIHDSESANSFLNELRNRIGFVIKDGPEDGIRIHKVSRNGPAWRAGIRPMDIVTKVDGQAVTTSDEFGQVFKTFKCGDPVPFIVERAGYLLETPCIVEVGAKSKDKNIVEQVRAMRLVVGMEIFEPEGLSDTDTDEDSHDSSDD